MMRTVVLFLLFFACAGYASWWNATTESDQAYYWPEHDQNNATIVTGAVYVNGTFIVGDTVVYGYFEGDANNSAFGNAPEHVFWLFDDFDNCTLPGWNNNTDMACGNSKINMSQTANKYFYSTDSTIGNNRTANWYCSLKGDANYDAMIGFGADSSASSIVFRPGAVKYLGMNKITSVSYLQNIGTTDQNFHIFSVVRDAAQSEFRIDRTPYGNITGNYPTQDLSLHIWNDGTHAGLFTACDWVAVTSNDTSSLVIAYGAVESGSYSVNGIIYAKRRLITIASASGLTGQAELNYTMFNSTNLAITAYVPAPPLLVTINSPTNSTYPGQSFTSATPDINITASGDNASYSCNITEGATYLLANQDVLNGTLFSLTNTSFTPGPHTLNATCFNSTYQNSSTITFTAINLYACGTLSTGGFYALKTNVASAGDCFDITGFDTLLDCEGHTLTGPGSDYGIYITAANASIYNCTATNYEIPYYVDTTDNATFINNVARDLPTFSTGFYIENSNFANLTNNSAYNCGPGSDGMDIYNGNNNTLANNLIYDNTGGLGLYTTSANNTLINNIAYNNSYQIYLANAGCLDNHIYNNNFTALAGQEVAYAYDAGLNYWNTTKTLATNIIGGAYIGGNWYSNYTGIDYTGDGIGNDTYGIGASIDYLPLTSRRPSANYTLSYYSWVPYTLYTVADGLITVDDSGTYYITYAPVQAAIPYQTLVLTLFAILGMWLIYSLFGKKRKPKMPYYRGMSYT